MEDLRRPSAGGAAGPGPRRRPPPLPAMRLGRGAQAALIGLRLLLGLTTAMALYAALHGHG